MRVFVIAADVIMGLILGLFMYIAVTATWPVVRGPWPAVGIGAAAVMVVLFRRPYGSLAPRRTSDHQ